MSLKYESRVLLLATLGTLPLGIMAIVLLWTADVTFQSRVTLTAFVVLWWLASLAALRQRVVFPLRTLSNLLAALREGDFSLRARGAGRDDALGEVNAELNVLGTVLREQRLGAVEAAALLRRVMSEIDVAVLSFDQDGKLRLLNQCAERLLGRPVEQLVGRSASDLGLQACLQGDAPRLVDAPFAGSSGRWELRRGTFLERGLPQQLLIVSDLTRTLREEERQAWKRLMQVLRHEVNNSLAPIHSLAGSLVTLLEQQPLPRDWEQDVREGLGVIAHRSESLNRFMGAYARLTKLPKPTPRPMEVGKWVRRIAALESRAQVGVVDGPTLVIGADVDQLDQLLINLVANAVEAVGNGSARTSIGWKVEGTQLELWVDDNGPGIADPSNLFVPFYTTKAEGSGIGLVLSRQIAEAHGGRLTLNNRPSGGCRALLRLPV